MKRFSRQVMAGVALTGMFGMVQASDCDSVLDSYNFFLTDPFYGPSYAQLYRQEHSACFGSSSTGAAQQINATAFTQALAISDANSARLNQMQGGMSLAQNKTRGLAAGGEAQRWNLWLSYDQSDSDVSYKTDPLTVPYVVAAQKIKGNSETQNTIVGFDYTINPAMVVGLSLAMDRGDGWSRNVTGGAVKIDNSTDGYIVAPYLGYVINKEFAVDVSAGWGEADFSTDTTKADIDRWFAAANLSYNRWVNNWQFTGKISYLHGDEDIGDSKSKTTGAKLINTDSSNSVDQLRVGAQVGYWMNGFMPYAGLAYTSNVNHADDDPTGRDAFVWTLGANFFSLASKVSGGLAYQQESGRDNADNKVLKANINFRF